MDSQEAAMIFESWVEQVASELNLAVKKYPTWPIDPIHGAAILSEEAGELVRATNNLTHHRGPVGEVFCETVQTGAMSARFFMELARPGISSAFAFELPDRVEGYESLEGVLREALEQASSGKGKERHANGKPFDEQPMMQIADMVGLGHALGQAIKKCQETMRLPTHEAKERELLGAINYIAGAIIAMRAGRNVHGD